MVANDRSPRTDESDGGRWLAVGAGVALLASGTGMVVDGRTPDPLTAALTLTTTVLLLLTVRWRRDHRRGGTSMHDDVDLELGVGNGRAALAAVGSELARAGTHGGTFSLTVAELDHELFATTSPRRTRRILGQLFRSVADDVRLGDRVCRVRAAEHDLMVVVLPDTGPRGARTFSERLCSQTRQRLAAEGVAFEDHLRTRTLAHPRDADQIVDLHRRLQVLEDAEALIRDIAVQPVRMPRQPPDLARVPVAGQ